jgi:hypothetical protein
MGNSFVHLSIRTWEALMEKSSLSTFGFVLFSVLVPLVVGGLSGFWAFFKDRTLSRGKIVLVGAESAGITLGGVFVVVLVAYLIFFVPTVYKVHQSQAQQVNTLNVENTKLTHELARRKQTVPIEDPAFSNIISLLQAFDSYRRVHEGKPCVMWFSATSDSMAIASMFARLSAAASACGTFGPSPDGRIDPDVERDMKEGMIPGVVVIHMARKDKAAMALWSALSNQVQTRISYEMPKTPKNKMWGGDQYNYQEDFIWLQFGDDVKWNGELL